MSKFLFLLSFLWTSTVWAKITAEFIPNPLKQGDTVELVFSSDTPFNNIPNIDLLKKDFVIGGQQRRQSSRWVNGKGSTVYQLSYTLFPNKSGDIQAIGFADWEKCYIYSYFIFRGLFSVLGDVVNQLYLPLTKKTITGGIPVLAYYEDGTWDQTYIYPDETGRVWRFHKQV